MLVAELGQLEEVHASAGGGEALQIVPPVMDAEGRVELLRRNQTSREKTDQQQQQGKHTQDKGGAG